MAIEKKTRRTQAERSASTRSLILQACIKCLCDHGYGATTSVLVAQLAGVSRGAMLHHFPTKAELIYATAEEVVGRNRRSLAEAREQIPSAKERYAALPDLRWEQAVLPHGVALLELMIGVRSDLAVREGYLALGDRLLTERHRLMADGAAEAGIPFDRHQQAISRTVSFAIRGMAIEKLLNPKFDAKPVLDVLRDLKRNAMDVTTDVE